MAMVVEADGKVGVRMLTLDRDIGDQWLVSAGLSPGDHVIMEGMQRVRPGATVKEVPFDANRKPGTEPAKTAQPAPTSK